MRAKRRSTVGPEPTVHRPPVDPMPWAGWPEGWSTQWGYAATDLGGYLHRVSTVMTCVDLNSRQLSTFPIYGVRRRDGSLFALPRWARNPEPAIYSSWSEFAKSAFNSFQLHGEIVLYATARFDDGFPARFMAMNPTLVQIEPDGAGGKRFSIGGDELDPADVLHVPYQTLPGRVRGLGPLEWISRSLFSAGVLESYAAEIAQYGVPALLKTSTNLTAKQADDVKATWRSSRMANPGTPAVISGGFEYESLSISPKDMALLDLRIFDEQRIAAAFGVPPFLIGLPQAQGLTYSNATSLFDFHWRATLRTMAEPFAKALSSWALPSTRLIEFNRDEYVRPALEERARTYQTLHGITDDDGTPAISVAEIRRAERFPPVEDVEIEAGDGIPPLTGAT